MNILTIHINSIIQVYNYDAPVLQNEVVHNENNVHNYYNMHLIEYND